MKYFYLLSDEKLLRIGAYLSYRAYGGDTSAQELYKIIVSVNENNQMPVTKDEICKAFESISQDWEVTRLDHDGMMYADESIQKAWMGWQAAFKYMQDKP